MITSTYLEWTELHNSPNLRDKLPNVLYCSWEKSYALGINPSDSVPLSCTKEELKKNKEIWKSLKYYANDVLTTTVSKRFDNFNFVLGLFDKNGCLIKLYGDEESLYWANNNNLINETIWDEDIIGTNAVSLGLKLRKSISVIGTQHFSKFAINTAMYFSPIIFEKDRNCDNSNNDNDDNSEYGGIAIIIPVENCNSCFTITAESIARGIALHFFWFESVNLFLNSVNGYLVIDQSDNKNIIMFISNQIFNFFKIPFKDMYYKNLEEIIDPYPKNKDFWLILNNKTMVEDIDINLSIQGTQVKSNFSMRPFYGRNFHIEGVSLIFNSRERIQNLISKHTGNNATFTFPQIIGYNEKYLNILNQAKAASNSNINILLLGESGVGKDIISQSIHNASERRNKPFVALNCAAFPKDLISSELFGYEEGAFTGSRKGGNLGKFELANHGTIFLDEIGDMPLDLQAILLRVLEQKSFMKIGSNLSTNIDVRIIAATNKNLKEKIQTGEFREDLYYRLGIIKLIIPPLRHRKDDILLLAEQFIEKICKRINKPTVSLSPQVKEFFIDYHWPGNVRELQNLLEGVIQIYDSPVINYEHIANYIMEEPIIEKNVIIPTHRIEEPSKVIISDLDFNQPNIKSNKPDTKEYILHALELNKNNKSTTAKYLNISRKTLYNRLKEYNLL